MTPALAQHLAKGQRQAPAADQGAALLAVGAATLNGQTLSDFATSALLGRARAVIQAETSWVLSARDARQFLEHLDADVEPNESLRQAAERSKRRPG
jgi:uncharacterized protein (DUF1778 family)